MSMYWGDFTCFTATTHFVANCVEFCKTGNFKGSARFITVLHKRGGTPKLYYVIHEQPLIQCSLFFID